MNSIFYRDFWVTSNYINSSSVCTKAGHSPYKQEEKQKGVNQPAAGRLLSAQTQHKERKKSLKETH